jgi:hypothetical protein
MARCVAGAFPVDLSMQAKGISVRMGGLRGFLQSADVAQLVEQLIRNQ